MIQTEGKRQTKQICINESVVSTNISHAKGYQTTFNKFVKHSKHIDSENLSAPSSIHEYFPHIEQLWDTFIGIIHQVYEFMQPFLELMGVEDSHIFLLCNFFESLDELCV